MTVTPEDVEWFYHHSLRMSGDGLKWVGASGVKGIRGLTVRLARPLQVAGCPLTTSPARRYTVRLHFAEPDDVAAGARVFDVTVQGKRVLESFDVARAAGGARRTVVREFPGVVVECDLSISLSPAASSTLQQPVLSGVEIVAEDW